MIETASSARIAQAYRDAHLQRSQILIGFVKWVLRENNVPLTTKGLTEPCR